MLVLERIDLVVELVQGAVLTLRQGRGEEVSETFTLLLLTSGDAFSFCVSQGAFLSPLSCADGAAGETVEVVVCTSHASIDRVL